MLNKVNLFVTNNIISNYVSLPPRKKKRVNKLFFFIKSKLRSYYTIPTKRDYSQAIGINVFKEQNKEFELLSDAYIDESIRDNVPSVSGYVPYLKNQTSVYFYHFFSINYGLRKTLIAQLSLIGDNDEIKKVVVLKIPSRFNGAINLNDCFKDLEGNSCVLEIFHPRIFNNHAGNQGHLRFWGVYGSDISTVHSMPLYPFIVKNDKPRLADRRYYPKLDIGDSGYFYNCNLKDKSIQKNLHGDLSSSLKLLSGYTIQMKENNSKLDLDYPSGVWHHSPFTRNNFLHDNEDVHSQVIAFPSIENIDAFLFLGEYVIDNQEIKFELYDPLEKRILSSKIIDADTKKQIQVSKIFSLKHLKGNIVVATPIMNAGKNIFRHGYINVQYLVDNTICDGVHAHRFTSDSPGQGLKFMHYRIDENSHSFFSIWGSKNNPVNYRLRIMDSNNSFEKCFHFTINTNEVVQQINLKDLGIPNGKGIIQLECDKHNPASTSFIQRQIDNQSFISVCHMTGG